MYEKFAELLRQKGITPYRVFKETGVSQTTLSDWKKGKSVPKIDKLQKIADYLEVPVGYFLNDGGQKEAPPALTKKDEKAPAPQEPSASLAYSPLEQEIIKAYRAAPPVLQEAVLNVLHIPIPASNAKQKKNA